MDTNSDINRSGSDDLVVLTHEKLCLEAAYKFVSASYPGCGGIATFVGVTRDNFGGKRVVSLEYEAYDEMAVREMRKLCAQARNQYKEMMGVAVMHRLGTVNIGEASVIIAVSSPHRGEAFACCRWLIDTLKATVPIWKKEIYTDGSAWKENAEAFKKPPAPTATSSQ